MTGAGATPYIAQNGIQISTGATGVVFESSDLACNNTISNSHGYPNGVPSADANISGLVTTSGSVGDQAGVSDTGNRDIICHNKSSGAGYAPMDKAGSLPNPPGPAWVRPADIYSFAAAIHPQVSGNHYDGKSYNP